MCHYTSVQLSQYLEGRKLDQFWWVLMDLFHPRQSNFVVACCLEPPTIYDQSHFLPLRPPGLHWLTETKC